MWECPEQIAGARAVQNLFYQSRSLLAPPQSPPKMHLLLVELKLDLRWDVRKVRLREEIDYLLKTARQ